MSDDLYVSCPRCKGSKLISVITLIGDDFRPTRSEFICCPLCYGTGEADKDLAEDWMRDQQEDEE